MAAKSRRKKTGKARAKRAPMTHAERTERLKAWAEVLKGIAAVIAAIHLPSMFAALGRWLTGER